MNLDAIEQRARAATEGPWEYDGRTLWGRDDIGRIKADTPEDRAFTTAARTDVPALVARVRELEEALQAATEFTFHTPRGDIEVYHSASGWTVDAEWQRIAETRYFETQAAALERVRHITAEAR